MLTLLLMTLILYSPPICYIIMAKPGSFILHLFVKPSFDIGSNIDDVIIMNCANNTLSISTIIGSLYLVTYHLS